MCIRTLATGVIYWFIFEATLIPPKGAGGKKNLNQPDGIIFYLELLFSLHPGVEIIRLFLSSSLTLQSKLEWTFTAYCNIWGKTTLGIDLRPYTQILDCWEGFLGQTLIAYLSGGSLYPYSLIFEVRLSMLTSGHSRLAMDKHFSLLVPAKPF